MTTVDSKIQFRLTLIFALLIGATALSWGMGHGIGLSDPRHATTFVLLVAFIKIRFVFLEFMEVRHAPTVLRVLAEAWIILVCAAVIWLYWLGSDPALTAHWPEIQGLTDFFGKGYSIALAIAAGAAPMKTLEGEFSPSRIQDVVAANFCDIEMTVQGSRNGCRTLFEAIHLGQIEALRYRSEGMQKGNRRWEHIRKDQDDAVSLYLPLSMDFHITTAERDIWLAPGHFAFIATRRLFSLIQEHVGGQDFYSSIYIKIPGALIRQRLLCIDDLCGLAFPIEPGASAIMRKVVEAIFEDGPALTDDAAARFGQTVLDVVVAAAESAAKIRSSLPLQHTLSKQRLMEKAKSFIEQNLSKTELSTVAIAEHCRVSVRYLHAAFAASGETIAGHMRDRRLELSRNALRDPGLRSRSIMRIAEDWGFSDASQFGRLYKSKYGRTPRQEREAAG